MSLLTLIIDSPFEINLGVGSPAPPGTVASGPRGARPLTVLLSIVAQLLIGCCSCSGHSPVGVVKIFLAGILKSFLAEFPGAYPVELSLSY